jgi:outer membrane receptor protein involved in Fe transport
VSFAEGCRRTLAAAALSLLAGGLFAARVEAAPRRVFHVRAEPLTRALLDFAIQANISIGADQAARCGARSPGVNGEMTVAQALDRILAGTGCGFRPVDATSVRIVREAPAPLPAPAARPAPRAPVPASGELVSPAVPELVVTATRRGAVSLRLPDAIRAIAGDRMAEERDLSIADLAGWTAGLTVTNLGPGSDKIIVRGLSDSGLTGHAQSTVGIYLDDTRLSYNAPDPDLRLTDVDRVEVLQGPQGTLYGSGSIAGLVHIVTRQPNLTAFEGEVSVSGAGTVGGGPSAAIEGVVNAPILPGVMGLRAVAYREREGGYISDPSLGRADANSTDRTGGRLAVKLNLGGDWSLELGAIGQTLSSADSQYAVARMGDYQRNVDAPEPHSNDFAEVHATLDGELAAGQFKNTLSVVRHDVDTRYDATADITQFVAFATLKPSIYQDDNRIEAVVDEATLASAGAGPLQWLVGGFLSDGRERLDSAITAGVPGDPTPLTDYAETRTDDVREAALYGEAAYALGPHLTLGAGARAGIIGVATNSLVSAPVSGETAPFRGRLTSMLWEPKLTLRYQFSDQSMAYLLVSEGARGGGFNTSGPIGETFSGPGGTTEPFRRYNGDELWNYEAGVKTRTLADHLDLRVAAFYAAWRNIQSDELLPSGLPYTANIGDGRNIGLEGEVAYSIGGLQLRLTSLLDAPELTHNNTPFASLLRSGLPGVPRGSVGGVVRYERTLDDGLRPFADFSVDYVGLSRLTFDAHTTRRMGDYTLGRLTGGVGYGEWRAAGFVDNVFGEVGDTFAYGNPFTLRHEKQITPLQPRTAGVELTRYF